MRNKMKKDIAEGSSPEYESIWDQKIAELRGENEGESINPLTKEYTYPF